MHDPDAIPDTPLDEFEKELEQFLHEHGIVHLTAGR
jgi:hypothetical protein